MSTMRLTKHIYSSLNSSSGFCSSSAQNILKSGVVLKRTRIFSSPDVIEYAKLSHDSNPLHFDSELAKNAGYEDRLVHGMLVASLFPNIIASHFPGAVYVSQTLHFKLPVYIGEEVTAEVQAYSIREMKKNYLSFVVLTCGAVQNFQQSA